MSLSSASFLTELLKKRLNEGLSASIYLNVQNPRIMDKTTAKKIHSEFIALTKDNNKEIDFIESPYYYAEMVGQYELMIEKLYDVDDNILLISLSPCSIIAAVNEEALVDVPVIKDMMTEALGAKEVTIKVTY